MCQAPNSLSLSLNSLCQALPRTFHKELLGRLREPFQSVRQVQLQVTDRERENSAETEIKQPKESTTNGIKIQITFHLRVK